jgi:hypothetical protein
MLCRNEKFWVLSLITTEDITRYLLGSKPHRVQKGKYTRIHANDDTETLRIVDL